LKLIFDDDSHGQESFEAGVRRMAAGKEVMLLPYIQDALIPGMITHQSIHDMLSLLCVCACVASEMEKLAVMLGSNGVRVHHEPMSSKYGHDAFLKEFDHINPRLQVLLYYWPQYPTHNTHGMIWSRMIGFLG
jgi:hypothetical protein